MKLDYNDLKRTALASIAKIFAALSAFILTAMIARNYDAEHAGYFFISFTFFSFLNILYKLGLDSIILRDISSKGFNDATSELFTRILLWIFLALIPFLVVFLIFGDWLCVHVFEKPELYNVIFWFIISLPFAMIYLIFSCVVQGEGKVVLATFFQNLGVSVIFIPMVVVSLMLGGLSINVIAILYFVANVIVCFIALYVLLFTTRYKFRKIKVYDIDLYSSGKNLWLGSVMTLLVWWGSLVISSFLLEANDVATLSAAQRTAYITSFILMVSNMAMAPRFSKLWFDGELALLKSTVKKMTRLLIITALPVALIIICFPSTIMNVFGSEYEKASSALVLFALGQFSNIIAGSASPLLNMTGNEKLYRIASLFGGSTAVVFGLILTSFYGVWGAAASTAIAMLIQNIVLVYFVKKKFGFYMFFD